MLPFNNIRDFFQWLKTVIVMIPITIYVIAVGIIFYFSIKKPENTNACDGYCDHFDDLL